MVFTSLKAASILAFITALTSAAPTARQAPNFPPKSFEPSFRLVANVTGTDLSPPINNFLLTSYHIGAGEAYAVLESPSDTNAGRIFYVNGTAEEVRFARSNILSDEGTPLFPGGIVIAPASSDGETAVLINAGEGTAGVGLTQFPDPISKLQAIQGNGFYACNSALPFGPAVQVFLRTEGEETKAGCADVVFLPQCSESSGLEHPTGQNGGCYADVAGIDWTFYSA